MIRSLIQFSKEVVGEPIRRMQPSHDPDFMIIGAQKCGTSSLHYYLDQHPRIIGSRPKEVHYFNRMQYFGKTIDDYRSYFRGPSKRLYFEATPAYLYHPDVARSIHEFYPHARFIVLMRDPVKRAYSAWNHYREYFENGRYVRSIMKEPRRPGNRLAEKLFKGRGEFPSFRECIDIELDMMDRGEGFEPAIIRRGIYIQQLQEYWKYYDRDRFLLIGFQDFIKDLEITLKKVTDFLGVESIQMESLRKEPQNRRLYTVPLSTADREFLQTYYSPFNDALFDEVGEMNW